LTSCWIVIKTNSAKCGQLLLLVPRPFFEHLDEGGVSYRISVKLPLFSKILNRSVMYLKPNYALGGPNSCQSLSGIKHISGYAQASYNRNSRLNPHSSRSSQPQLTLRHVIICASTNDNSSSRPQRRKSNSASTDPLSLPFSYTQDLLAREGELWKRQSQLLDEMKDQYANEIQRWVEERAIWQAQEQSLKQEISDLRAQLLYALSSGLVPSIDNSNSNSNSNNNKTSQMVDVVQPRQLGETMGQPSYQSATTNNNSNSNSTTFAKTPAEEVQAVLNASRQADSTTTPTTQTSSSSSSSAAAAVKEVPSFASEFMQAMHAPDDTDVLDSALDFSGWQQCKSMKREERRSQKQDDDDDDEEEGVVVKEEEKETSLPPSSSSTGSASIQPAPLEAEPFYKTPPPPLAFGEDDLFWVNQLHTGLVAKGYYPGDDDIEDFMFTDGTQRAVMTMQACEGLVESGVVDEATWKVLLGPELRPLPPNRKLTPYDEASDTEEDAAAAAISGSDYVAALPASSSSNSNRDKGKPFIKLFSPTVTDTFTTNEDEDGKITTKSQKVDIDTRDKLINQTTGKVEEEEEVHITLEKWPVLMEGDGGREVHALHVVLTREGYYPGEDDIRWWTYGDTTVTAVKTFQACQGMPESGVVDIKMWGVLMGGDAVPSDIYKIKSGESDDDDLAQNWDGDRVWLMGEQRWETINKKKSLE